jgi:hypothetical protein
MLVTVWCEQNNKIPDSQFGFYPGRDTMQPLFIIRHLVRRIQNNRKIPPELRLPANKLFTAFVDFTQAYDKIDRSALWSHLEREGMPSRLLNAIKGMYAGDSYVLVDGEKRTSPIHPTLGVKQGCPLSPLLFSLYINDFQRETPRCRECGVKLPGSDRTVSDLFYADDLTLLSLTPHGLQSMLDELGEYCQRKGLIVNTSKSVVVVFNSRAPPVCRFKFGATNLEVRDEFKYLGILIDRTCSMEHAENAWGRALACSGRDVLRVAREHGVRKRLGTVLRLYQTYATSAGMYGCQVWGTRFLKDARTFCSRTQRQHTGFLRRLLGVRPSTPNWVTLQETNQKAFQQYWWRAVLRFWNKIRVANSPLLREVVKCDVGVTIAGGASCWAGELLSALEELGLRQAAQAVRDLQTVDTSTVMACVNLRHQTAAWGSHAQTEEVRRPTPGRSGHKLLIYDRWFRYPNSKRIPTYLDMEGLRYRQVRQFARFRVGAHRLRVETGRWQNLPWDERECERCSRDHLRGLDCPVDDEYHLLFDCDNFAAEGLNDQGLEAMAALWENANCQVEQLMKTQEREDLSSLVPFIGACMSHVDELGNDDEAAAI